MIKCKLDIGSFSRRKDVEVVVVDESAANPTFIQETGFIILTPICN